MLLLYSLLNKITSLDKFYKNPKETKELSFLQKEFELDFKEAVLLSVILKMYFERKNFFRLDVENLMDELKIKTASKEHLELLRLLRKLAKKDVIVFSDNKSYRNEINIDENVLSILLENKKETDGVDFEDIHSVLDYLNGLFERRSDNTVSLNKFFRLIREVTQKSKDFKVLSVYTDDELGLFYKVLIDEVKGNNGSYASNVAGDIYDTISQISKFMQKIYQYEFKMIKDKIIEVSENSRFINDPEIEINKTFYFKLFNVKKQKKEFTSSIVKYIPYKKIDKTVFFDGNIKRDIDLIAKTIQKKNFKKITRELKACNLSSGIVALFYGYPGTGKTASAYYLAKISKRDVLQVNISNIRDKYVGESEKRLKAVFQEYERAKKELNHEPILLFNEADALIGRRISANDSVDVMNNAMQNILLEELENFEGIFIATTNLIENMDDAFNRRFLYKIEYKKPSETLRKKLWLSRLPQSGKFIDKIVRYELTGGQIENVARKALLDSILNQREISLEDVKRLIEEEIGFKKDSKKVGLV